MPVQSGGCRGSRGAGWGWFIWLLESKQSAVARHSFAGCPGNLYLLQINALCVLQVSARVCHSGKLHPIGTILLLTEPYTHAQKSPYKVGAKKGSEIEIEEGRGGGAIIESCGWRVLPRMN